MSQTINNPEIIEDRAALDGHCQRLRAQGWFAFDTEFVGEDQYRPETCLIQTATADECAIIDPLAGLDARPLWELIADPAVEVIVHSGTEDVVQCWKELGAPAANVFDLQLAAGLVGHGYPTSLSRLSKMVTGRKIHKSQTLTDWRKRPLTDEQIRYAAEDVVFLKPIYDGLHRKINALGRIGWLEEECKAMCAVGGNKEPETQRLKRLKGAGSLSGRELAIAYALMDVRDELAKQYNRPIRTVVKDHLIVELARRGWTDAKKIRSLRGLNLNGAAVKKVAESIEAARNLPKESWPELPVQEDTSEEEVLISLLSAVMRDFAGRKEIAYSLLCRKQALRSLIRTYTRPDENGTETAFASGWRKEAVGGLLDGILDGTQTLRVASEGTKKVIQLSSTSR